MSYFYNVFVKIPCSVRYIHIYDIKYSAYVCCKLQMADNTSVQVAIRIRPLVQNEISKGSQNILEVYQKLNQIKIKNSDKAFSYNSVFDTSIEQDVFYNECVKNMIENLFKGYNVTILAYGQTGSGKTYSMGTAYNGEGNKGVIPHALNDIFNYIKDNFR